MGRPPPVDLETYYILGSRIQGAEFRQFNINVFIRNRRNNEIPGRVRPSTIVLGVYRHLILDLLNDLTFRGRNDLAVRRSSELSVTEDISVSLVRHNTISNGRLDLHEEILHFLTQRRPKHNRSIRNILSRFDRIRETLCRSPRSHDGKTSRGVVL